MNSKNFQRLRKEFEPILPEILPNSRVSELLQDCCIPESEAVKVERKVLEVKIQLEISLPNQQLLRKCVGYYDPCPFGQHFPGGCEHEVDC